MAKEQQSVLCGQGEGARDRGVEGKIGEGGQVTQTGPWFKLTYCWLTVPCQSLLDRKWLSYTLS